MKRFVALFVLAIVLGCVLASNAIAIGPQGQRNIALKTAMEVWIDDYAFGEEWTAWAASHSDDEWLTIALPKGWNPRTPKWGSAAETVACIITAHDGAYINGYIDEQLIAILEPYMGRKPLSVTRSLHGGR
jgi:hypothetical protein